MVYYKPHPCNAVYDFHTGHRTLYRKYQKKGGGSIIIDVPKRYDYHYIQSTLSGEFKEFWTRGRNNILTIVTQVEKKMIDNHLTTFEYYVRHYKGPYNISR